MNLKRDVKKSLQMKHFQVPKQSWPNPLAVSVAAGIPSPSSTMCLQEVSKGMPEVALFVLQKTNPLRRK
jgi:hypothetical protein